MAGFQEAKREQIWLKVLLAGPSGSGKTYSALRIATGIAKKAGSKIAAIDTENRRIRYYADEFKFDDMQLESPFKPDKYIEAIDMAIDGGYKVLIIDSITHEWDYCLDIHSKMPGNSYTNWAKITPMHNSFIEKVLQSPLHVVATVRGKDEYILEERDGKKVPKKIGLGMQQRGSLEYNYTVTFNIDQKNHVAEVTKDNTHLFEDRYEVLTEKDGMALYDWANSGDAPPPRPVEKPKEELSDVERLANGIKAIDKLIKEKVKQGVSKKVISEIIKQHHTSNNFNSIDNIEVATNVYKALDELKKEDK